MDLDTRARRAADGVRASARGVDPMAQITELRHEDKTRRRTNTLGAVGAMLVVAAVGVGWFVMQDGEESSGSPAVPLSTPSGQATTSEVNLTPGRTVGAGLRPPLVAKAPDSWTVFKDGAFVWIDADGSNSTLPHIDITGPLVEVFDVDQRAGVPIPPEGYASWLREHPWLEVLDDRTVVVDGQEFPQLTMRMDWKAPEDEVPVGRWTTGPLKRGEWPDFSKGERFTLTVIEVDGQTMVVTSAAADSDPAWDELDAGHELVLSTMKLPS